MESIKKEIELSEHKRRETIEKLEEDERNSSEKKQRFAAHRPGDSMNENFNLRMYEQDVSEHLQREEGGEEFFRQTNVFEKSNALYEEEPQFGEN